MYPQMYNLCFFVVKSVLWQFTLFCREISFVAIYALLCGENVNHRLRMWRKYDKYEVCFEGIDHIDDLSENKSIHIKAHIVQ